MASLNPNAEAPTSFQNLTFLKVGKSVFIISLLIYVIASTKLPPQLTAYYENSIIRFLVWFGLSYFQSGNDIQSSAIAAGFITAVMYLLEKIDFTRFLDPIVNNDASRVITNIGNSLANRLHL